MQTSNHFIITNWHQPETRTKKSRVLGMYSSSQTDFEFALKSKSMGGHQMCDRIDFFTHHSIKHNMDFIEGINVYFNGRLTGSYGNSTNNWCVKKLFLTKTTIIESVNAKSRSVIEKLEFRLVDDSKPKLIEIGSDNDQKAEKIDAKKMEIFGVYGSFAELSDGSKVLNTFGLVYEENTTAHVSRPVQKKRSSIEDAENDALFKIPIDLFGFIIGKGGCNINKIREETSCRVQINEAMGMCEITGPTKSAIKRARHQVEAIISESREKFPIPETSTITIPVKLVGIVIGKNGIHLKDIYKETNCRTQIDDKTGVCEITGPREKIHEAMRQIQALVKYGMELEFL